MRITTANIVLAIVGADSCKLNICNSIEHLCKCWADVLQMPHHRQYVKRYQQAYNDTYRNEKT